MELDHIAVAAWKLEDSLDSWKKLGFEVASTETVPGQGVKVAFLEIDGGGHVELLEPLTDDSMIHKFLKKRGPGLHHIAFKAESIDARMKELGRSGLEPLSPEPTAGSRGTRVCFFHPKTTGGVLVELVEHPEPVFDPRD